MLGSGATRDVRERGVARVEVREVRDLIGAERTAATRVVGPPEDVGFEESAVDDQLTAAFEEIEQAHPAVRPSNV